LYAKQKALDGGNEFEDTNDAAVLAAKTADEAQMMKDFKDNLAGDRIAQFDRSQDPDYQNLTLLSQRYDLPADAADTLVQMRQAVEEERQKLLSNKDIPPERLETALQAMQTETEKAARQTLGDKAFEQFSQTAAWVRNPGTN
jgi:glutamine synthetase